MILQRDRTPLNQQRLVHKGWHLKAGTLAENKVCPTCQSDHEAYTERFVRPGRARCQDLHHSAVQVVPGNLGGRCRTSA